MGRSALKSLLFRRITALVENVHLWAMSFWEAVGYRVDERIVRRVRNL
jgi:hypothetical protein